ncbi:MAG: BamA/TamA family outer membrane protein [Cyanobacteria bacterium P01_D01_bin.123]
MQQLEIARRDRVVMLTLGMLLLASGSVTAAPISASPASGWLAQAPESEEPNAPPSEADAPPAPAAPPALDDGSSAPQPAAGDEAEVLVAEVLVTGTDDPELIEATYRAISTRPGRTTTRSQLQSDISEIFATGFFSDVEATPSDTDLGVRVTFDVTANPVLRSVTTENATILPDEVVEEAFASQQGKVLNFGDLQAGVQDVEQWYTDNGYVLAKVADVRSSDDGDVTLELAEGEVEDIRVEGNTKTRDFIVTREMDLKPGDVFNRDLVQDDLQKVFALNLFQDVNLALEPAEAPEKVVAVVNVEERNTGALSAGAGISSSTGVFGTLGISEQNLGGNNQNLSFDIQLGTRETLFDINFTDPRIAHWETPTSFNASIFNQLSDNFIFDDGAEINRLGLGFTFSRPISPTWRASLGFQQEFVTIEDQVPGNILAFNSDEGDNYTSLRFGLVNDRRDSALTPSRGSVLRFSSDQSIRVLANGLTSNRLESSYSFFIPVDFTNFSGDSTEVLAFDVRTGSILGSLAPYDAFLLGGSNTIRGYERGDVAVSRSYALASAEYRFPLFNPVGGVLFADYGSDLGGSDGVLGNPTALFDRPGSAFGVGLGLRVQSPVGALRIDYGLAEDTSRLHFSIGEKF